MSRRRGGRLVAALALSSLGALAVPAYVHRDPITTAVTVLRLKASPSYALKLLEQEPESPWGRALREFVASRRGQEALFQNYVSLLSDTLSERDRLSEWVAELATDAWIVVVADESSPRFQLRFERGTADGGSKSYLWDRSGDRVADLRAIQDLLGGVGAARLTCPDYQDVEFAFVSARARLEVPLSEHLPDVAGERSIEQLLRGGYGANAAWVGLARKAGLPYPKLLPLSEDGQRPAVNASREATAATP